MAFLSSGPVRAADVEVLCVGDVMLAHGLKPLLKERGMDYPFARVKTLLRRADIVFGNLENPASARGEDFYPEKEYRFLMEPAHMEALRRAGFRVMSLANNHTMDFGPAAMLDTARNLEARGILSCGAGSNLAEARRPAVVQAHGRRVAFLAYARTFPLAFSATALSPGTAFAEESAVREDVARAKRENDWVVVSFHWGEEYTNAPTEAQRGLARATVEAGADAVVGHHPHVPQGLELYRGKPIAYSLGNFAFGTRNPGASDGLALLLRLSPAGRTSAEVIPLSVDNARVRFQPAPLQGEELREALERLRLLSRGLGTELRIRGGRAALP